MAGEFWAMFSASLLSIALRWFHMSFAQEKYQNASTHTHTYIYIIIYTYMQLHTYVCIHTYLGKFGGLQLRNGCLFWQVLLKKDTQTVEAYHVKCQTSNRIKEGVSFDSESCKSCRVNKILGHGGFN